MFPAIFFLQKTDLGVLGCGQCCVISQALFSTQYNLGNTKSHLASQEKHLQMQPPSNEKHNHYPAGQALHRSNKPDIRRKCLLKKKISNSSFGATGQRAPLGSTPTHGVMFVPWLSHPLSFTQWQGTNNAQESSAFSPIAQPDSTQEQYMCQASLQQSSDHKEPREADGAALRSTAVPGARTTTQGLMPAPKAASNMWQSTAPQLLKLPTYMNSNSLPLRRGLYYSFDSVAVFLKNGCYLFDRPLKILLSQAIV